MSTRGLYTIKGEDGDFNIYKHNDNYPSGAARTIKLAVDWFAWKLPRYESDEFATAFVTACKFGWIEDQKGLMQWYKDYGPQGHYSKYAGGGVRLMPAGNPTEVASTKCSGIEYRYEISFGTQLPEHIKRRAKKLAPAPVLLIKAFEGSWWDEPKEYEIFNGPFDDFYKWALAKDKEVA